MFTGLTVTSVDISATALTTLGELLRTVQQALTDMRNQTYRDLFLDFNGVVRDASCVCGPYLPMARPCILTSAGSRSPGARCSIFLLTIAGEVDSYKSVTCTLSYNGLDQTAMKARLMEICSTVRKVCTEDRHDR
ncbi:hypothetical protein V1506DRAFT_530045 [Lipomyces tetrasporus]